FPGGHRPPTPLLPNIDCHTAADFFRETDANADSTADGAAAGVGAGTATGADRAAGLVADAFQQHTIRPQLRSLFLQTLDDRIRFALGGERERTLAGGLETGDLFVGDCRWPRIDLHLLG